MASYREYLKRRQALNLQRMKDEYEVFVAADFVEDHGTNVGEDDIDRELEKIELRYKKLAEELLIEFS